MKKFFVTGTDTGVGKTYAMLALGSLLINDGHDVGVFKPVQSGVGDAEFLKRELNLPDALREINPFFAREPLSPHLALRRAGIRVTAKGIKQALDIISSCHEITLIEGAGGLLVPITPTYLMVDFVRDSNAELIIVARLGLGTINHTLLTVREAQRHGIKVAGILFSDAHGRKKGIPEKTNPLAIQGLSGVPVLGVVPFLKQTDARHVVFACKAGINYKQLLKSTACSTERLVDLDKKYVWHPFTQMQDWCHDVPGKPLVIDRGEGSYLIDSDGKRYIDGVSSLWVTVHGHRKNELDQALKSQVDKIAHSTMLGLSNTPAIELAEKLLQIAPKGLSKVFYSDNGSTAVEVALKMAYQYWQNKGFKKKTSLVHLANSYHGDTLGSVSVGGIDLFHQVYRKLIFKTIPLDISDGFAAAGRFEALLKSKHDSIAALVVEPLVQGAAGMLMWPNGLLKRLAKLCRQYDVFLIADEVATGFGRTGTMFACEHENVSPDFLCVAKGLTGGYLPLAATLTSKRVFDGFLFPYADMKTFFHGHTYTGNPLACAVACANIDLFRKDRVLEKMQPKIKYLHQRLRPFKDHPFVGKVRQLGFMVGIELFKDRKAQTPFDWKERIGAMVCERARHYGVLIRPLGNVIVLMPPLSISKAELDLLVNAVEKSLQDVLGA